MTGWQLTSRRYKDQIELIIKKMYDLVPSILPENRTAVDYYLTHVCRFVSEVTMSLQNQDSVPNYLAEKFTPFVRKEEEYVRENLEQISFDIDALDTVHAVVGNKIERVSQAVPWSSNCPLSNAPESAFFPLCISCCCEIWTSSK